MNIKSKILFIVVCSLLFSCKSSNFSHLNKRINKSQKRSIKTSDLESGKGMTGALDVQLKFRDKYLNVINQIKNEFPTRPILLFESYDFICSGCAADYIVFFNGEVILSYRLENFTKKKLSDIKYDLVKERRDKEEFKYSVFSDLTIIYENALKGDQWNKSSKKYGTDECFDGSQSFYTMIYPNGRTESMYMRCWTAEIENN